MKTKSISVTVLEGNLFAIEDASVDTRESASRYCSLLEDRIQAAFPGADVSVELEENTGGSNDSPYCCGFENDEDTRDVVAEIEEALFTTDEWYVDAEKSAENGATD